jgi:hypothetical protein
MINVLRPISGLVQLFVLSGEYLWRVLKESMVMEQIIATQAPYAEPGVTVGTNQSPAPRSPHIPPPHSPTHYTPHLTRIFQQPPPTALHSAREHFSIIFLLSSAHRD